MTEVDVEEDEPVERMQSKGILCTLSPYSLGKDLDNSNAKISDTFS